MTEQIVSAPSEVRTFLIADVRGYTDFTRRRGDEAAAALAAKFAAISREVVSARRGEVVELRGDEVLAVFSSARQALRAAVALQDRFARETEADLSLPLRAGIGLDAGEAIPVEGGYRGGALNLAARLSSHAGPGEVLASEAVVHLAQRLEGVAYGNQRTVQLKGFADPVRVIEVLSPSPIAPDSGPIVEAPATLHRSITREETGLPTGGFVGARPDGPMVAREEELNKVIAALEDAEHGNGRLVLLAGEPGIGKTRLAQEAAVQAWSRGFLLAAATCYEQRQAVPFYPFVDALSMLYTGSGPAIRDAAPRRWPYLGRLLPESSILLTSAPSYAEEEQDRLFRTVVDFVQSVAEARAPVALMLDDLQWADDTSLELVLHLARSTRTYPVFLLAAYRDADIDREHPLQGLLLALRRQQLAERLSLTPLQREGTAALVEATTGSRSAPTDFVAELYRRTEGNPLFVREVLQTLLERSSGNGALSSDRLREIEVPETVRALIEQRLAGLSEQDAEILREASVIGQRFTFESLQQMGSHSEREVETTLDNAVKMGLVRDLNGEDYAFSHALMQQTLYDSLSSRRRRRLHLAAAEALERLSPTERRGRASELAWHFLQGDAPQRALPFALEAGDAAEAVFAHAEAERLYRLALQIIWETEEAPDAGAEAAASERLGVVLRTEGKYEVAIDALERAAQIYRDLGRTAEERRIAGDIGLAHAFAGRSAEGIARLEPLVQSVRRSEPPSSGLGLLLLALGVLYLSSGRYREALETVERAVTTAREARDEPLLTESEVRRAEALAMLGRHEQARAALAEIVPRAEQGDLVTLVRALNVIGTAALLGQDIEEARRYYERALESARKLGDPRTIAITHSNLARVLFILGDWTGALRDVREGLEISRSTTGTLSAELRVMLSYLEMLRGDSDEAVTLEEAARVVDASGDPHGASTLASLLAEWDLLQGRPQAARDRLEPLLPAVEAAPGPSRVDLYTTLAHARLETGDLPGAESLVLRALQAAASTHARADFAVALAVQGMLRGRQERWEEAERLFENALGITEAIPNRYNSARILEEWGKLEKRRGRMEPAEERLERAIAMYEEMGARPYVERARQELEG